MQKKTIGAFALDRPERPSDPSALLFHSQLRKTHLYVSNTSLEQTVIITFVVEAAVRNVHRLADTCRHSKPRTCCWTSGFKERSVQSLADSRVNKDRLQIRNLNWQELGMTNHDQFIQH